MIAMPAKRRKHPPKAYRTRNIERIARHSRERRNAELTRAADEEVHEPGATGSAVLNLQVSADAMRWWTGMRDEEIEARQKEFLEERADLDSAVIHAIKKGMTKHPVVRAWLADKSVFGEKDLLRKSHRGLETGVQRMMDVEILWVIFMTKPLVEAGIGPQKIRPELLLLINKRTSPKFIHMDEQNWGNLKKRINNLKRSGFHRFLRRLGVIEPSDKK